MKKAVFICLLALILAPLASAKAATTSNLKQRLMGRIIIAVQSHGEAYYISPKDQQVHQFTDPASTYSMIIGQGLGISEKDFNSFNNYHAPKRLAGRIVIRSQARGEAYYVNPTDLRLWALYNPISAFNSLVYFGLGVSNADLAKILNSGNTIYQNKSLGFQISVPTSWKFPGNNISEPEFFSSTACSKQQYFNCPSFKIVGSAYGNGPDNDFSAISSDNPIKLTSLISGATVIEYHNYGMPDPNDDSLNWAEEYDVFFPAEQKAFIIFAPDRSLENTILPTLKLLN
jgi:hypothetical protein